MKSRQPAASQVKAVLAGNCRPKRRGTTCRSMTAGIGLSMDDPFSASLLGRDGSAVSQHAFGLGFEGDGDQVDIGGGEDADAKHGGGNRKPALSDDAHHSSPESAASSVGAAPSEASSLR